MTTHFQSFLFDLLIWIAYGAWVGYWSATVQESPHEKRRAMLYSLSSLSIGLWSVLTVGLPDAGFAILNFIYVSVLTFMVALLSSRRVQSVVEKAARHTITNLQGNSLTKVHGRIH